MAFQFHIWLWDSSCIQANVEGGAYCSRWCSVVSSPSNVKVITVSIGLNFFFALSMFLTCCTAYVQVTATRPLYYRFTSYVWSCRHCWWLWPPWHYLVFPDWCKSFCDFIFDSNLIQLVESPTHIKGNILDIVLIKTNYICDLHVDTSITSDHYVVTFKRELSMQMHIKLSTSLTIRTLTWIIFLHLCLTVILVTVSNMTFISGHGSTLSWFCVYLKSNVGGKNILVRSLLRLNITLTVFTLGPKLMLYFTTFQSWNYPWSIYKIK